MITDSELKISNESYTRKDFYQIYPEILDLVNKITDRWMPSAESNESDPGVVLLKMLGFIADKTNYNIDKNILECFMPSATQEDSMRKLCDMMGYDMHYYRSGETKVSLMWTGTQLPSTAEQSTSSIGFPAFETVFTDDSNEVTYVLTEDIQLTHRNEVKAGNAIEGTYCQFEVNEDNIVKYYNLDDNLRLYFSEPHVAENGVWIYNAEDSSTKKDAWKKVSNLNTQTPDTKVWKFGYDTKRKLPYIQFPKDVVELMENGLCIYYIRTSGQSGNISAKTLTTLANQTAVTLYTGSTVEEVDISSEDNTYLIIQNVTGSINGADAESIDEAYNGFKKTVGTFDTLVTCRDYANAIYNLLDSSSNPYVSNVIVSDIRDNLNFSKNIITLDAYGCHNVLIPTTHEEKKKYKIPVSGGYEELEIIEDVADMNHFDLYILPFKPITTSYTSKTFQNSFKPTSENYYDIINELENYKTVSHEYKTLDSITNAQDIYCFKNKYQLKGTIATTYKVNSAEQKQILNNIYEALYKNFNARKVDFGQAIPYDTVLSVIENADNRIKVVILEDFTIVPYVLFANGLEYQLKATSDGDSTGNSVRIYQEVVAKNVLAGKLPLFNYDTDVEYKYGEQASSDYSDILGGKQSYPTTTTGEKSNSITYIDTSLKIDSSAFAQPDGYKLTANQSIQFISPAYEGIITYPAYTNYYMNLQPVAGSRSTSSTHPCNLSKVEISNQEDFTAVMSALSTSEVTVVLYAKSSKADFSRIPGYLVDDNYYKYSPTTTYYNSYEYYSLYKITKQSDDTYEVDRTIPEGNTLGQEPDYRYITKNTEYKLLPSEWLAIYYKDSDGNSHNILYTGGNTPRKKETINGSIEKEEDFSGVIKCNFDLYNSNDWKAMNHAYVKTTGYTFDSSHLVPGMFSLGASDEVEIREKVEITFDETTGATLKCYWYTNEPKGKLTFTKDGDVYQRILDADEYFFYTNDAETVLVTYGSGTILKLEGSKWTDSNTVWELPTEEEDTLNTDDIASNGIGAFNDVTWQIKSISSQQKLTIAETTIVNLGEGDILKGLSVSTDDTWREVPTTDLGTIIYNQVNKLTSSLDWKVRSILNLNLGPNCVQTLTSKAGESGVEKMVEEKIMTYTSRWYYKDSQGNPVYVDPKTADKSWSELFEEKVTNPTETFENISIKANYLVQRSGGKDISAHRYNTDKEELDDLLIIPFIDNNCEIKYTNNSDPASIDINSDYTKIDLSTLTYLSLPINLKANKFGVISFYYTKGENDDNVHICIYPSEDHESGQMRSGAKIGSYSDRPWLGSWSSSNPYVYNLKEGLNCLYIKNASYVIIHPIWESGSSHDGTLVFTQLSVINDKETKSGVDYKLLGLQADESDTPNENNSCEKFINQYIINENSFFVNAPINNNDRIDVETMNPAGNKYQGWENTNNVINKFTIPELDVTSFPSIEIARSSKI